MCNSKNDENESFGNKNFAYVKFWLVTVCVIVQSKGFFGQVVYSGIL